MAKSNSMKPAKSKTNSAAKSTTGAANGSSGLAVESAAARTPGVFSTTEIGHVAGDVWGLLVRDGTLTVAAIKKSIDAPGDVVLAAIGWLAREDKLEFLTQGRSVKVSLR